MFYITHMKDSIFDDSGSESSLLDVAIVLEYTTADQEMKLEWSVLIVSVWFLCVPGFSS